MEQVPIESWLLAIAFFAFCLAMFAIALRFTRKADETRAAGVVAPGRRLAIALYVVAALHAGIGIGAWLSGADGEGLAWGVLLVSLLMAGFYVACANVTSLVHVTSKRTDRRSPRQRSR